MVWRKKGRIIFLTLWPSYWF